MIRLISSGLDVSGALADLEAHPELWDEYSLRTTAYGTPHKEVSDIWVRYNPWRNFTGDAAEFVLGEHESEWYPGAAKLPSVRKLVDQVIDLTGYDKLGGVLITRICPHGEVKPHIDNGWHARYYDKFAVQLMSNDEQGFHFDSGSLVTKPGDLYTFDNSYTHWVTNPTDEYRMTLIICLRKTDELQ